MTDKELIKEAREQAKKIEENQTVGVYDRDEDLEYDKGWNAGEISGYEDGYIAGYNKANKWNYPSKGEYPKDGETVFVCRDDMQIWTGNRHSKRENSYFWYIHNLHGVLYKDSDIYAWKEIILPKEIK